MESGPNHERRKRRNFERAEVKAEYKELGKRLKTVEKDEDLSKKLEFVKSNLTRSDELYSKVSRNLGGTAVDAKFLRATVDLAQRTSKLININTKPFDIKKIIRNVKRDEEDNIGKKMDHLEFAEFIVKAHVNTFLCNPPTFEFFYGTIRPEDLVIAKRKPRVLKEKLVESKPVTAKERNIETEVEQDSTPKEVEHIYKQIRKIARKNHNNVSFFKTLVDPKSFTQTVENIFHISFLVKEGEIGVKPDSDKSAVLTIETNSDSSSQRQEREQNSTRGGAKQSIFSFSMDDYKNWISKYKITELAFKPRHFETDDSD